MLTRSTQVGEFYVMGPPMVAPNEDDIGFMDLIIYDEESDRHVRVTWESALAATCVNSEGKLGDNSGSTFVLAGQESGETSKDWADLAKTWGAANKAGYKAADSLYSNEKVYIVLCRPFIEHLMHSAIVAVAGRDTGATLFGPAGVLLSHDADPHYSLTHANRNLLTSSPIPALYRHADLGQHPGQNN
jgi:hypothetical protein